MCVCVTVIVCVSKVCTNFHEGYLLLFPRLSSQNRLVFAVIISEYLVHVSHRTNVVRQFEAGLRCRLIYCHVVLQDWGRVGMGVAVCST